MRTPASARSTPSAALTRPGVVAVFTGADLEADGVAPMPCLAHIPNKPGTPEQVFPRRMQLVADRVRHVGDAVAMVVAESAAAARGALADIAVDYEPLPATIDAVAAMQSGAPQIWPEAPGNLDFTWADGDAKARGRRLQEGAALACALDLVNNRVVVNSMEPRGAIGQYDSAAEAYTLYTSSQGSHLVRDVLCGHIFKGLDPAKMRVVTPDVGGGFGMKVFVYAEMVLVLWAAKRLGRPVRWIADRSEAFISDSHGRDNVTRAELALDGDSRVLAVRVQTTANLGAYLSQFGPYIPTLAGKGMQTGVYAIPAAYNEVKGVFTNTVPVDAYRGAGRPEAAYIIERLMDAAGRATGLGPVEIRRRNMIPAKAMPYTTTLGTTFDDGDFPRLLSEAVKDADWDGFEARRREAKGRGRLRGIGLAYYIETCGGGPSTPAMIRVEPDRTVTVIVGNQSNGQGHETAYAQIVSEQLGIPFETVRVRQGDTALMAKGSFTGGSRALPTGGPSARYAADDAIAKGKEAASHLLETNVADIEYGAGSFRVVGTDRAIDLFDVAAAVRDGRAQLASGAGRTRRQRRVQAGGLHLSQRLPHLRARGRSRDRHDRDRPLHRRRRLRPRGQSAPARRPGAWRHRPGRRPGAGRAHRLQRRRPAPRRPPSWTTPCRAPTTCRATPSAGSRSPARRTRWASRAPAKPAPSAPRRR